MSLDEVVVEQKIHKDTGPDLGRLVGSWLFRTARSSAQAVGSSTAGALRLGMERSLRSLTVEKPPVRRTWRTGDGVVDVEGLEGNGLYLEKGTGQSKNEKRYEAKFRDAQAELERLIKKSKLGEMAQA